MFQQIEVACDLRDGISSVPDQTTDDLDLFDTLLDTNLDLPGVFSQDSMCLTAGERNNVDSQTSIIGALRHFENSVDMIRVSSVSPSYCEQVIDKLHYLNTGTRKL